MEQVYKIWKIIIGSCGIFKTMQYNVSYLLLFWKREVQSLEISCE